MRIEEVILRNLIYNSNYTSKVLPHIKEEYFSTNTDRVLFTEIARFIDTYKSLPSKEALTISLYEKKNISEDTLKESIRFLDESQYDSSTDFEWLLKSTEKFCQDQAIYNAIKDSVNILDGSNTTISKGAIPGMLSEALGVSFDSHIGHDYLQEFNERYNLYHTAHKSIPFDIDILNRITKGGFREKTLNVFLAGPKVGKSLVMCHIASSYLLQGYNVLYITLEMAEERIAERIDVNVLNLRMEEVSTISSEEFSVRMEKLRKKIQGQLIIKEYPTSSASVTHFRSLLNDLKLKKGFRPDAIIVDYMNICLSSRLKMGGSVGSYLYVKSIAEELRGLAVEYQVPIISATQLNRTGATSSDPGMSDTSECIYINEEVTLLDGSRKKIVDVIPGDQITSNDQFKTVTFVHHKKPKECVKVTLKSGKTIIVSKDHVFPTNRGRLSVSAGMSIGDKLNSTLGAIDG